MLMLTAHIVVIVCMSRLVYRKGIDLLIGAMPEICAAFPNVRFVIGMLLDTFQIISDVE